MEAMADTTDYLTVYKRFFENFAKTVDPDDQLPVRVAGYRLWDNEIVGETVDWTLQYLSQRNCPPSLLAPIIRIVIEEIKQACETQPQACGFKTQENCYLPLKLMRAVTNKVNEVCLRFCDNGRITTLPPPTPGPLISSCAVKNSRRCMEDRHVILEDFHAVFSIKDNNPASYYAVFDGHAGTDAAIYSVSHLHQFLAESSFYPTDPEKAIKDAFFRTDNLFIEKSNKENLRSGTTAVCALLRPKEKKLYVAWLGDSQAILVRNGQTMKLVNPHKPDRKDEMTRIQDMGGSVLYWGTWRVNGQLAVSRAIGDLLYKPYVTAEPDVKTIDLLGNEDFLILACDGLWDFVSAEDVVRAVYEQLLHNSADIEAVSQRLVQLSKQQGSTDNISVIVAFLTEPSQLAARARESRPWASANGPQPSAPAMEAFDVNTNSAPSPGGGEPTNPFEMDLASPTVCPPKAAGAGLLLDLGAPDSREVPPYNNGHPNGNLYSFLERSPNGKVTDEDEDSGQENHGDIHDKEHASLMKNPFGADIELQRQQLSEFDPANEPRHDTPTPPADDVPGVVGLVSDNVAESGEESEDEWNYYRVEPSGKSPQPSGETEQQTKQKVCPEETSEESAESMESRLNPDAAEFIPSPTHTMPSMEEYILSQSKNDISMDDVEVPSRSEFENEVSSRPSEVDFSKSFLDSTVSSANTSDLLQGKESESDTNKLLSTSQQESPASPTATELEIDEQKSFEKGLVDMLDESAAFSTKAEYGDESTTSFMTTGSDFQKITNVSSNIMESSFIEQDLNISDEHSADVALETSGESVIIKEHDTSPQQECLIHDLQKEPVHISFELQKEIAPQMESQPERVKVDSTDHSPILESEPDRQSVKDITNLVASELATADNILQAQLPFLAAEKTELFSSETRPSHNTLPVLDDIQPTQSSLAKFENDSDFKFSGFQSITKIEETCSVNENIQNTNENIMEDFTKPLLVLDQLLESAQTEENIIEGIESCVLETEKNLLNTEITASGMSSQLSGSELRDNLAFEQDSLNQFNNEISTPEYEKLEQAMEASELEQNPFLTQKEEIPVNILLKTQEEESLSEVAHLQETPLETAHPDKTALLDDACVEIASHDIALTATLKEVDVLAASLPESESPLPVLQEIAQPSIDNAAALANDFAKLDMVSEVSNSEDFLFGHSQAGLLVSVATESTLLNSAHKEDTLPDSRVEEPAIATQTALEYVKNESSDVAPLDTSSSEPLMEDILTPPPAPLVTREEEPSDLNSGRESLEHVQKLSSAQEQSGDVRVSDEVQDVGAEVSNQAISVTDVQCIQIESELPSASTVSVHSEDEIGNAVTEPQLTEEAQDVAAATAEDSGSASQEQKKNVEATAAVGVAAGAAAVAAVATAAAAAAAACDRDVKKEKETTSKKSTLSAKDKKPTPDKPKMTTKTTSVPSRLTATAKPKSPTSPVKSPIAQKTTLRQSQSSVPNKPLSKTPPVRTTGITATTTTTSARSVTSTTTSTASKSKQITSLPPAKPTAPKVSNLKARTSSSVEKKPLANGDIKTAPKRPENLLTKPLPRTQRPATAPVTKTVSKTTTTSLTKAKSLGDPPKPRPMSSVTQVRMVTKTSSEKEIKESANKQISTRTTTVRSTTATAAKTSVTSTARKVESKVMTNGKSPAAKTLGTMKSSTATKAPLKKPLPTTARATSKTSKTGTVLEKSGTVQGSKTVAATNEVKSEVLIETTHTAA